MDMIIELFGRFHPILLHFPIGILLYCYMQIIYDTWRKKEPKDLRFPLFIGCSTAVLSSLSGFILSQNGDYSSEIMDWHKYLGIATAIISIFLYFSYRVLENKIYLVCFTLFVIILSLTGHFGASLTHGSDFLIIRKVQKEDLLSKSDLKKALVFDELIMPFMDQKCVSCHNPNKRKGDLLLDSAEGWQKGGKTGAFFVQGNSAKSLSIERIKLERTDKEHMPPDGKSPLNYQEIKLLEWWILNMDGFKQTFEEMQPSEEITEIVESLYISEEIEVNKTDKKNLDNLEFLGLHVVEETGNSPWLDVRLQDKTGEIKSVFKALQKVRPQLKSLDLSESSVNDSDLSKLKNFDNLAVLNLANTQISSNGIKKLKSLKSLRTLNLFGTKVDKEILGVLSVLPGLESVYLWQTSITKTHISDWKEKPESLYINLGADQSIFGEVQLIAPLIEAEKDIFRDSLQVRLNTDASLANVYYSLDGSEPDSNSLKYSAPFFIKNSCEVNTFITMKGWKDSEVKTKRFVQTKYSPVSCILDENPSDQYKARGGRSLIDFEKGTEIFRDGRWLGFEGKHFSATIDLGSSSLIRGVSISSLQDYVSYIFFPNKFLIEISKDGKTFTKIAEKDIFELDQPAPLTLKNFSIQFSEQNARFVRVLVKNRLKNPDWHPAPGSSCWVFIDEIIIE